MQADCWGGLYRSPKVQFDTTSHSANEDITLEEFLAKHSHSNSQRQNSLATFLEWAAGTLASAWNTLHRAHCAYMRHTWSNVDEYWRCVDYFSLRMCQAVLHISTSVLIRADCQFGCSDCFLYDAIWLMYHIASYCRVNVALSWCKCCSRPYGLDVNNESPCQWIRFSEMWPSGIKIL